MLRGKSSFSVDLSTIDSFIHLFRTFSTPPLCTPERKRLSLYPSSSAPLDAQARGSLSPFPLSSFANAQVPNFRRARKTFFPSGWSLASFLTRHTLQESSCLHRAASSRRRVIRFFSPIAPLSLLFFSKIGRIILTPHHLLSMIPP